MRYTFIICLMINIFLPQGIRSADREKNEYYEAAVRILRKQVMEDAAWAMQQEPVTITAYPAPRSAGGKHDFFSEGDYFWPNPKSPDSIYISKDGISNPDNFVSHRLAVIRFSKIVGALASAYKLTHEQKYAQQILKHCNAWFVNEATLMNPFLLYAQAVRGGVTGRGIGIIDSIQLLDVVQGLLTLTEETTEKINGIDKIKQWFEKYIQWLMTHPYGLDEMNRENNHGSCWVMQVAAFAKFTGNRDVMKFCSDRFKTVLLPNQLAEDGSFPRELRRSKPYGYSIFNMDALATICQLLSSKEDDLWRYATPDGRTMLKAISFLEVYLANKNKWPYKKDITHWDEWPVAQPSLLFFAKAFQRKEWLLLWERMDHKPQGDEVVRNLPVRYPILWIKQTDNADLN